VNVTNPNVRLTQSVTTCAVIEERQDRSRGQQRIHFALVSTDRASNYHRPSPKVRGENNPCIHRTCMIHLYIRAPNNRRGKASDIEDKVLPCRSSPILPIIMRPRRFTNGALNHVTMVHAVIGAMNRLAMVVTVA